MFVCSFVCFETWFACVDHTVLGLCVAQYGLKLMYQPCFSASLVLGLQACSAAPACSALLKLDCSCISLSFLRRNRFCVYFLITCFWSRNSSKLILCSSLALSLPLISVLNWCPCPAGTSLSVHCVDDHLSTVLFQSAGFCNFSF